MKVLVIGGVAAGTKAAAKIKREDRTAEVIIYTKGRDISYAGCGLPYYVGGQIETREELIVNTPESFSGLTDAKVITGAEVTRVNTDNKTITVKTSGGEFEDSYDKLIIASGATAIIPPVEGVTAKGVFVMRTPDDAIAIRDYVKQNNSRNAVIVGGGFIGLEAAENLKSTGLNITVIDMAGQLMPGIFDSDMADFIRRQLIAEGIRIQTGTALSAIKEENGAVKAVSTSGGDIAADVVILSIGIRPSTAFLENSGIKTERGLVITNEKGETNIPDVYSAGDCAMVKNRITGEAVWSAMGSTANLAARSLALNITGTESLYKGCYGTGVVKLTETLNAGRTGLTEAAAKKMGIDTVGVVCMTDDKAHYYPDSTFFAIKLIAQKDNHRLIGIQAVGGAVDKLVDIAVTAITFNAAIEDFSGLDYAYAPPFSTAIHPFVQACYILQNKMSGRFDTFTPIEYIEGKAKDYRVLDAHPAPTIRGAEWINLANAENAVKDMDKDEKLLLVCAKGKRGYMLSVKLKAMGFTNLKVLEGGATFNTVKISIPEGEKLPADEVKRLKGLGCLWDKRSVDRFNVRVITVNGKITSEQHAVIAKAAEMFGNGEITMTTRLTLEIQSVPYKNIEPLMEYLNQYGLETGGTGSLVRPVVSCKGTTCQYGLIDTFDLSEKIHERFYKGYHSVTLPHKFKIAVGGCPNNCVKPDLNDLGIVGQRVPLFDFSKCRGCKKCQVETSCPIKAATVSDGMLKVTDCNSCGRCKSKCPFGVTEEYTDGYKVYIGGRWGKKIAHGTPLSKIFTSEEEVMDVVERAILFFRNEGITGERFADTIDRLGFDYVEDKLLHGEIKKSEILKKTVKGGASC